MVKLTLRGHEDRYAVEQMCLSLFDLNAEGEVISALHRGKTFLTAVTTIAPSFHFAIICGISSTGC